MKTCDTCKWWGVMQERVCDLPDTIQADKDPAIEIIVVASCDDDQGLVADLVTGPKFGCIRHQNKED